MKPVSCGLSGHSVEIAPCALEDLGPWRGAAEREGILFSQQVDMFAVRLRKNAGIAGFFGIRWFHGSAVLKCVYVLPEYRRRGLFRLMTEYSLRLIRSRGIERVDAHATAMSASMYLHLGAVLIRRFKFGGAAVRFLL